MANAAALAIDLGQTYYGPTRTIPANREPNTSLEGSEKRINDYAPTTSYRGARVKRSNRQRLFVLVRNGGAANVLPKQCVKWKATFVGKQVDGAVGTDGDIAAGIVDETLPAAGARPGDLFWLCIEGPTLALKANTAAIAEGAEVISDASAVGVIDAGTLTATTAITYVGRCVTAALEADTEVLIDVNRK